MTSLSQQLQQLAVPYVENTFASDKKKKSLLFDPKEAANLDRETIFDLGSNGLEELEAIDDTFEDFKQTLFNESSQDWERSLQTSEVNKKLDKTIEDFLIKSSPYLLIKSTHKALEWLVYRYHIHQMNVDAVMMCILPYHQTNIFVRMLQLLEIEDKSSKWNWLLQVQKSGVTLSRLSLINHVIQDKGFLSFICGFPVKYIKILGAKAQQLQTVISFYTCTILGSLQNKHEITEKIISELIPYIIRGLKSKCQPYRAATYMILSQLAVQITLQEDFLDSLLPVMTKQVDVELSREMLLCLTILYQTQRISKLPKVCFNHLSELPGLTEHISSLSTRYDMSAFIESYLQRLIPKAIKSTADSAFSSGLTELLQGVQLSQRLAMFVSTELLSSLLALRETQGREEWRKVANVLLSLMDRKYSLCLDKAVEDKLSEITTKEERKALSDILKASTSAVKYQMVSDDSTTLYLGLNHTKPSIRSLAVEQLANNLNQNLRLPEGFAEGTLLTRLHDDNPSVVEAVLKIKEKLLDVFEKEKLANALLTLVHNCIGGAKWLNVCTLALDLLTNTTAGDGVASITLQLLPIILVRNLSKVFLKPAFIIMSSELATKNTLLKSFAEEWLMKYNQVIEIEPTELEDDDTKRAFAQLNWIPLASLIKILQEMKGCNRTNSLKELCNASEGNNYTRLIVYSACCEVAVQCKTVDDYTLALKPLLDLILEPEIFDKTVEPTGFVLGMNLVSCMGHWVSYLYEYNKLHIDLLVWIVDRILTSLPRFLPQMDNKDALWWNSKSELAQCLVKILDRMMSGACSAIADQPYVLPWRESISKLIQHTMDPVIVSKLFCLIITWKDDRLENSSPFISATLQVGSIHLLNNLLTKHASRHFLVCSPVLETIMTTMLHEAQPMRQAALKCVKTIQSTCDKDLPHLNLLLKTILRAKEEIMSDAQYFPLIVKKITSSEADDDASCVHQFMLWIEGGETPIHIVQQLLRCVEYAPDQIVVDRSLPLVSAILQKCQQADPGLTTAHIQVLENIVSRLVCHVTKQTLSVLLHCLHVEHFVAGAESPHMIAMNQVSKTYFRGLPGIEEQRKLISATLDVFEKTQSSSVVSAVHRTLRGLKLDGMHVAHELSAPSEILSVTDTARQRSKRMSTATTKKFPWKRATLLLEVLQSTKSFKDPHVMLGLLFDLLKKLVIDDEEELEYRKRLVLSCVHNITKRWPNYEQKPTQESINMESLVKCVSNSASLQTQQQALIVMASVANFFPDYMLHNVMSIFTFVGGGLLQQDDSYSLQVITTTVQTIIPALLRAHKDSKQTTEKLNDLVAGILQVFVDARHAVPKHRCMLVFQTLVETLGCDLYLWMIAVLVMQSAACSKQMPTSSDDQEWSETGVDADSMFCINIYEQFSAKTQMSALSNVLHFVQKLTLCHKPEATTPHGRSTGKKQRKIGIVDMTIMSPPQIRLFQYHLTKLIASVLQHEAFIGRIVADLKKKNTSHIYFKQFVQEVLTYMTSVASLYGQQSAKETQARFWRALISKVYDILDKVNYLLPTDSLLEVVGSLVTHDLLSIRRKALDLLVTKLQQLEHHFVKKYVAKSLLQLVDVLTGIAEDASGGKDAEFVNCRQHALFSLKLICRLVAQYQPRHLIKLYDIVVPMLSEEELPVPVLGVSLLCLAELCSALKAHSIAKLGVFVPPLIDLLRKQDYLLQNDMLLSCSLVATQKVLSTLPHFLSPYLLDIVLLISQLADKVSSCDDKNKKTQSVNRIEGIRQLLCSDIPPRVLIPILSDSCDSLVESSNPNGLKFVAQVAEEHIRNMKKEDLSAQHSALVNFFCKVLDLRNATKLKLSLSEIGEIEDGFIDGVLAMVVKLSENSFRPMYYKLYDWACREDNTTTRNRQLAFFKISCRLAEKLKGLFNLFIGHSLQSMCQTLEANRSNTPEVDFYETTEIGAAKSCELLTNIIDCLYRCMLHDSDGLFQKDIFKVVMQPLIDQIENYVGGAEEYEKRIMNSLMPCISQLSVVAKDDPGWKSLNYQVILKTRHTSPKVRFGALQVEEEIANKLGEEFMVLLPEAIPFLAELMEDEVEEVEQKCQEVIRSIEQAVNEDLQKYF